MPAKIYKHFFPVTSVTSDSINFSLAPLVALPIASFLTCTLACLFNRSLRSIKDERSQKKKCQRPPIRGSSRVHWTSREYNRMDGRDFLNSASNAHIRPSSRQNFVPTSCQWCQQFFFLRRCLRKIKQNFETSKGGMRNTKHHRFTPAASCFCLLLSVYGTLLQEVESFVIPTAVPKSPHSHLSPFKTITYQDNEQHISVSSSSSSTCLFGIPKMFRWLTDQYPDILNRQLTQDGLSDDVKVDNFYLDMNGIIHPATHGNNEEELVILDETAMFKKIFLYVDR